MSYHSKLNESMYTEESISGKGQEYAIVSFFSRINFDHSEKYLIEFSLTELMDHLGLEVKINLVILDIIDWMDYYSEEEFLKIID